MPAVDLLVIGGGIHGACVARDAALRGLNVTLVERYDLASGTSSRSSKLIHGGLRYLETGQFGLVREALRERAILVRTAPGLVRRVRFMLPFYEGDARPAWLARLGLSLYDLLKGDDGMRRHEVIEARAALELEPDLPTSGLKGAALYDDAQMDDALLVIANAVAAAQAGADIRTWTEVVSLMRPAASTSAPWRAGLDDGDSIEARAVVVAAGPWSDDLLGRTLGHSPRLRRTRGTHILLPKFAFHPLLLFARRDKRVFFVLPQSHHTLVGTTDDDDDRSPDEVAPTLEDVRYLWDEVRARWSIRAPNPAECRVFAGVRPLVRHDDAMPWQNSREAVIVRDRGVFALLGGKFTTARALAQRTVDAVVLHLGASARPCTTDDAPLPQLPNLTTFEPAELVRVAVGEQFAIRLADVVFRRCRLWLRPMELRSQLPHLSAAMAVELDWSEVWRQCEVDAVTSALDHETALLRKVLT